ncbi:MAG: hypothetical protein MSJ26_10910 [Oscillospiraceae bacterium]|nr:hypothetical protein [Oscillospiraceae bacterium]
MKFRISFVLLFVFSSFLACFALYMRSGELPQNHDGEVVAITEDISSDNEERTSTADINPIAESAPMDESYFDSCMFAGDSLIVGLGSYGIIPEENIAANIGMSVMSINNTPLKNPDGSEILAADKINERAPENLYILLGLNLLGSYTDEQLLAAYGDFIDSIDREKTNIYIISVPPVTGARETNEDNPILNSDIDSFNSDLLKFANNRCVYFVDLNTALKGSDGRFSEEYAEADGIHFKKSTYRIMLDYLLSHVHKG